MRTPVFSVVIPTYNRSQMLIRAINSVLNQTFQDFELIIADDASDDGTEEIVKSFDDPRINYIKNIKNQGPSATRNSGVLRAKGEYVAFLDDDDEYLPDFVKETYYAFKHNPESTALGWCGVQTVKDSENDEILIQREYIWRPERKRCREKTYLSFLKHIGVGSCMGLTIRRSCFNVVGLFDENISVGEDKDLILRIVRRYDYLVVPEVLVKLHQHMYSNLNRYTVGKAEGHGRILKKNMETVKKYPDLYCFLNYKVGWLYYHIGNRKKGRKYMLNVLKKRHYHLKSWLTLIKFEIADTVVQRFRLKYAS